MRRICAVALIIVLGSLLGRVSGQSTEATPEPVITQDTLLDVLATPEIEVIPTIATAIPEVTDLPSPTDIPTQMASETPLPLPTVEATAEIIASPSQETVPVILTDEAAVSPPLGETMAWELSVRELFEDAPETPWRIPQGWMVDANQRLSAAPEDQSAPLLSAHYEAALISRPRPPSSSAKGQQHRLPCARVKTALIPLNWMPLASCDSCGAAILWRKTH